LVRLALEGASLHCAALHRACISILARAGARLPGLLSFCARFFFNGKKGSQPEQTVHTIEGQQTVHARTRARARSHSHSHSHSHSSVGMQDYVGSNNLPLLTPNGQFGTRLQGGKDAASARQAGAAAAAAAAAAHRAAHRASHRAASAQHSAAYSALPPSPTPPQSRTLCRDCFCAGPVFLFCCQS
jgi:hypothetical protein